MTKKVMCEKPVAVPFVVGGDGRVYISEALISATAITMAKVIGPGRAVS
ncbi:hypothetical protein [Pseudomonas sp. RW405]|nr:hypothetical protein [Pseudomonas sp. RW405]